jgi:hypothetical protein
MVVAAIRAEQVLILTHDSYRGQLRTRVESLVQDRLPDLPQFD